MADISNKTFITLIGITLFVSAIGMFSTGNDFFNLVGFATSGTGQARINVTPLLALNMTQTIIDFGNGTVAGSAVNCTISSDRLGLNGTNPEKCFVATSGMGNTGSSHGSGFTLANVGNVIINVTVKATKNGSIKTGKDAFWGVKSQNGLYKFKCRGNGTSKISSYTNVNNLSVFCQTNVPISPSNYFVLDINLTIPKNATNLKNDTLTFTASRACATAC
ncbi:hypothetical protein J4482_01015 [Candidatus Woesearchaeota archaeon]|nr:hypothetical protein [Candidatus Woesearchaeota archaeon]